MKTFSLSLFLLIVSISSFCQIIWSPPGAIWHNNYTSIGGDIGYVETKYVSDAVIAGINCKKLIEHQCYRFYLGGNLIDSYKNLYTYESGGVIFMFNLVDGSNNWDTLYNFNTPVNGIWHINSTDTIFIKVYGAGTKIINSDTLQWRAINYVFPFESTSGYDTLYERIGLTGYRYGFINPVLNCDNFEPSIFGICNYSDNTFALYGKPDSICKQLPNGISELDGADKLISVYPNPASHKITFDVSGNRKMTIVLYDILSRQISQKTFTNSTTINLEPFKDGIYFYKLSDLNTIIRSGKIIKQ
ncbi:MAG: T9SS type A sorting domain-containing protein [Bacteroidia bacterium]|nr:T9SS type A sorting domain-containing protein [Bacteroidia bacterium]